MTGRFDLTYGVRVSDNLYGMALCGEWEWARAEKRKRGKRDGRDEWGREGKGRRGERREGR